MKTKTYIVNVEGAIFKDDRWLIIKRSDSEEHAPGVLSFVGGKVETETIEDDILEKTMKREILEEVDVHIKDEMQYLESKIFKSDKDEWVIDIVYLCEYLSGEPKCNSLEEVSEVNWMKAEDILENSKAPIWFKKSIEKAVEFRNMLK